MRELLLKDPQRISVLLVVKQEAGDRRKAELFELAQSKGVKVASVSAKDLDQLSAGTPHQSFGAVVESSQLELKDLLADLRDRTSALLVLVDAIQDPHNFGAVLRASECMGVDGVIYSRNRGAGLTAAVSKSSAGASELVTLVEVGNLAEACRKIQEAGFWLVGAEHREGAKGVSEFQFPERTALLLGSEGSGIQPLIRKRLDFAVEIPLFGQIDSLNVSQAAAIALYEFRRQHPLTHDG